MYQMHLSLSEFSSHELHHRIPRQECCQRVARKPTAELLKCREQFYSFPETAVRTSKELHFKFINGVLASDLFLPNCVNDSPWIINIFLSVEKIVKDICEKQFPVLRWQLRRWPKHLPVTSHLHSLKITISREPL